MSTIFSLQDRTAVVVGATSGIGKSIALALADAGANVVPTGRRREQCDEVASLVEQRGARSLRQPVDVSNRESITELRDATLEAFGQVHILVNCAGKTKRTPTLDVTDDEWNSIFDTNVTGALRCSQIFGRHMIEQKYGRIVNIASLSTFVALYEVAAYCASKAAIASLTKSLAIEWARHGICVNAIAPGVVRTELNAKLLDETQRGQEFLTRTPLGRFGTTDEIASAAVYLSSDAITYVNGVVLPVDGGFLASGVNQ
ncbi:SDR family NAD(P)-dependent oxidoreductase [Nevskia soli]|uniref:SDR family NAD(P)-dependent oxidoreductase n=1 Tax=Nevskia soli TaxID=418856 RepID=UPI0015D89645|nr:glucose 1-dehydrogenase [Nevskia soli]